MTQIDSPHAEKLTAAPGSNFNYNRIQLSDRTLALILATAALVIGIWCLLETRAAKNRADVAIMRTEGFTRALIAKGIDPYPHLAGEDP